MLLFLKYDCNILVDNYFKWIEKIGIYQLHNLKVFFIENCKEVQDYRSMLGGANQKQDERKLWLTRRIKCCTFSWNLCIFLVCFWLFLIKLVYISCSSYQKQEMVTSFFQRIKFYHMLLQTEQGTYTYVCLLHFSVQENPKCAEVCVAFNIDRKEIKKTGNTCDCC